MPGINLSELSPQLQQTLKPYVTITGSVEAAITAARAQGKLTPAFEKEISSLNGNKAWGKFDGFESQIHQDFAEASKENPLNAFSVLGKKAVANDVAKNPQKYTAKRYDMNSGRYVIYQKDAKTGKDTYKYYDKSGKELTANAFKQAEGLFALNYDAKSGKLMTGKMKADGSKSWSEYSTGEKFLAVALAPLALFASCQKDDITEYNFYNENKNTFNITFDTSSLINAMNKSNEYEAKLLALLEKIENNTSATVEELAELKEEVKKLKAELEQINKNVLTVITNQEVYAKSADEYYKQIISVIAGNQDLLKFIVNQLTEGNDTLKQIKALMEKNNANQEEILEAISKCKYGIDMLHEDNEDIKKLLVQINAAIEKLPDNMKDKFSEYFKSIIVGIADNGAKLDQLVKIQETLNAILNKIGNKDKELEKLAKLLETINNNTVINGETQKAILEAINNNHTDMMVQFTQLVEIGNKNNELQAETNELIKQLAAIIKNLNVQPVSVDALIRAINANGADISSKLADITTMLTTINGNVIQGNNENKQLLSKILEAICKKPDQDFSKILSKLDEILKAIKDHKVTVDVTGKITVECNCGNGETHEGIIENLDWILG